MSETQKKLEDLVELCLDLQTQERELEVKKSEVSKTRDKIIDMMKQEDYKFVDLPEMLRVTLVEFVKESVDAKSVQAVKELLNEAQRATVIKTKEFIDKDGIKHLKGILSDEVLAEVLTMSPVTYIQFRDREK